MTVPAPRDERVWEFAYWLFQAAAWGAYVSAGLVMVLPQTGPQPSVVGGYISFFFYSIALTHAMRRVAHRRDWLSLTPAPAAMRLLGAALVVSSVQVLLILLVSWVWNETAPTAMPWGYYLSMIASVTAGTLLWTACYTGAAALLRARRARQNAVQLELAMREARLKALEAQIGPHFLFNCLNTLRGLIVENPPVAQDIVTRLANILRHNLTRRLEASEPLREQVEFTQDYLALESLRFEERLRTHFAIAPETLAAPVPAMLLQTLVENALKHGISHLPEGGDVTVSAEFREQYLVVVVENTGSLQPTSPHSTRVGLNNLRERLRVLHGPEAKLDVGETADGTVRATVRIPRQIVAPPVLESTVGAEAAR